MCWCQANNQNKSSPDKEKRICRYCVKNVFYTEDVMEIVEIRIHYTMRNKKKMREVNNLSFFIQNDFYYFETTATRAAFKCVIYNVTRVGNKYEVFVGVVLCVGVSRC